MVAGGGGLGGALGGIGGAIGGAIGLATMGEGGEDEYKKAVRLWQEIQDPNFDFRELAPPELRLLGEYFPETYDAVVPEEFKLPEDSPAVRTEQEEALGVLGRQAREGLPTGERLAAERSQDVVADEAGRQFDAGRQALAARGRLSGGAGAALGAARGQTAANLARDMGSDLTQQAINNRYRAALGAGQAAGAMRGQDIGLSQARANTTNRFNELVSSLRNQAQRDAFQDRLTSRAYNVGQRQRIGDTNELNRYGTARENLNRRNQLEQQQFGNEVTRTSGQTQALNQLGAYKDAEQAARLSTAQSIGKGVGQAGGGALSLFGG